MPNFFINLFVHGIPSRNSFTHHSILLFTRAGWSRGPLRTYYLFIFFPDWWAVGIIINIFLEDKPSIGLQSYVSGLIYCSLRIVALLFQANQVHLTQVRYVWISLLYRVFLLPVAHWLFMFYSAMITLYLKFFLSLLMKCIVGLFKNWNVSTSPSSLYIRERITRRSAGAEQVFYVACYTSPSTSWNVQWLLECNNC